MSLVPNPLRRALCESLVVTSLLLSACATSTLGETDEAASPLVQMAPELEALEVYGVVKDSSDPFLVLEHLMTARTFYAQGQFHEAAADYQTVLLHDPHIQEAGLGLVESLYALGRIPAAKLAVDQVEPLNLSEAFSVRLNDLTFLIESYDQPSEAIIETLLARIDTNPDDLRFSIRLAQLFDMEERWTDSEEIYQAGLRRFPQSASLHNNYAMSLVAQGRMDVALIQFERASAIEPDHPLYRNNLQIFRLLQGNLSTSDQFESANILTDAASILRAQGATERAEILYKRGRDIDPAFNPTASQYSAYR